MAPLLINHADGTVELVAGFDEHGQVKPPTDPRARRYLTAQQTDAAIDWIKQQPSGTPWMATLSYSTAHLPAQQPERALLPPHAIDGGQLDCLNVLAQRILINKMLEAMDTEIGRLLVEVGLATRTVDGRLDYRPDATDTMVVIVGDNGSYLQTVRLPFDPTRGKGTVYQTGVWVPLIVSGPLVNPANVGREIPHMVNAAVDVFALFGEVAGLDVRQAVPPSHALDAQPLLPYLANPGQKSLRQTNFTQTGTVLSAPGIVPPCVLPLGPLNVCTQIFTFEDLCTTEGGTWDGDLENCCQVQQQDPSVTLLPHASWAIRDEQFKLARLQVENCDTNQLELQHEFYRIDEAAPFPTLVRAQDNLLSAPTLPPQGLTPEQRKHFNKLLSELDALLRPETECPGDGNFDKRVDDEDLANWQFFADKCAQNLNQCSSVYDLNYDAVTDMADRLIIEANFMRRCPNRGVPR